MDFWSSKKGKMLEISILGILTIFGIGSQYFSNLAYSLNQGILQTSFGIGSQYLIIPSVIANFAFALGVPLGHTLTHKFGFRRNFLFFVTLFLIGSIIGLFSFDLIILSIAKGLQSLSTGVLFFTLLPKLFLNFPKQYRNVFLLMVIVGLFGANALGGLSGSLSLELDRWHWIFIINIISAILCLILGSIFLTKEEYQHSEPIHISRPMIISLVLSTIALTLPMGMLTQKGYGSLWVWPILIIAILFIVNFVVFNHEAKHPFVHFKTLLTKKPLVGATMAISSHLALLCGIAGINVYIIRILKLPFTISLHFYLFFFIGVIVTGFIKMFIYSAVGAGVLGTLGSSALLYVSVHWMILHDIVNIHLLYIQGFLLGFGASMTLVSGAMATLLDGDLLQAGQRSQTMHTIRNYAAAFLVPVIAYLIKYNIQKGTQSVYTENITNTSIYIKRIKDIAIDADHKVFLLMIIFNSIMLVSSIIQMSLGKGRRITPPRSPKNPELHLNTHK
ncbi:MFS transporter [Staphylococcus hominis]|jgi:DHA2 family multidrug resistance protein-like MFS transporter|uniref:MFS transporter n=1 Tax=Staphylococcus hominis TaxID=1290 RepID=UPI001F44DA5D|nr:MFS transporter [Staphylococcus hominis]UJB22187.1 MFS transporter [Staphylococcus hominis]